MQVVCILILTAQKEWQQGIYILGEYYSMNYKQKVFENKGNFMP